MYLDDFVEIIGGKICGAPRISHINATTSQIDNLLKGDAFILRNHADLSEAINRGAYAIVSDCFCDISDDEVALVLVDSLEVALNRFVKYMQLTNGIEILRFETSAFAIAKALSRDKNIAFAKNIFEVVEAIHCRIIVVDFESLFFEVKTLKNTSNFLFMILYQTLFELKIEFENNIYELILPNFLIKDLNNILHFFKQKHIEFKIAFDENLFLPLFINTSARAVKYGQSMRFILATNDKKMLKRYMDFVLNAKWGHTLLLSKKELNLSQNIECKIYKNNNDLLEYFMLEKYHFFIVYGIEKDEIILKDECVEQSLF